ncbi:MAG: hypothetical protein ACHQC8_03140 [Solirubrobacterales bacterium]
MYNVQITTTATKLVRKIFAAVAIGAVAMAFIGAGPAHADTKGTGPAKGCLIENNGKLETVAVGSKIGLFTCGSDGEWHFGWLINAVTAPPHKTVKPVNTGAIRHGVLRAARVSR